MCDTCVAAGYSGLTTHPCAAVYLSQLRRRRVKAPTDLFVGVGDYMHRCALLRQPHLIATIGTDFLSPRRVGSTCARFPDTLSPAHTSAPPPSPLPIPLFPLTTLPGSTCHVRLDALQPLLLPRLPAPAPAPA